MASNYYYIATPFGDLEQPCWRLVEAEVGGAEAIVFALRLRGLAAQAGRGGIICLHDGEPMNIAQICSVLGYTHQLVQRSLELLGKHHLAEPVGEGVRLLDPLLLQHLQALEAPKGPKSAADRARAYRQRKAVTQNVTKPRDTARDGGVTQQPQDADIYNDSPRHETSQNNSNIIELTTTTTTTPYVVVDQNDLLQQAKALLTCWPAAAGAAPAVAAALSANHSPEFVMAQIEYARQNAKSNPCAYLQGCLQGDYAGFCSAEEAKAASAAAKQAKAAQDAALQAAEDALLPPVTAEEFFSTHLEALHE